jgi:hypothetical protein
MKKRRGTCPTEAISSGVPASCFKDSSFKLKRNNAEVLLFI